MRRRVRARVDAHHEDGNRQGQFVQRAANLLGDQGAGGAAGGGQEGQDHDLAAVARKRDVCPAWSVSVNAERASARAGRAVEARGGLRGARGRAGGGGGCLRCVCCRG